MMRRDLVGATTALVMATAFATGAAAAEYEWTWQSYWQPGTVNQEAFRRFAENVEEKSDGRIVIEALPVDAVVPQSEVLDAVGANILQGSNGGIGYYVGKDPAFALLADFNAGYENPQQLTDWFYEGGGNELARELYEPHGVYFIGPVLWGAESIPSKMPLRNIDDFEGIKMRAPEGMGAAIWRKLAVGVSTLPGTEVYTALERGKIEATDWGTLGMNDELGYGDIAEYVIYPGIHSMPANDAAINLDIWERGRGAHDRQAGGRHGADLSRQCRAALWLVGRQHDRHRHLHQRTGRRRGDRRRLRGSTCRCASIPTTWR